MSKPVFTVALLFVILTVFLLSTASATANESDTILLEPGGDPAAASIQIFPEIEPNRLTPGDRLVIRIVGRIAPGSHLYSVKPQGEFAPKPTGLIITTGFLTTVSELTESKTVRVLDDAFEMTLQVHKNEFWISRQFKISEGLKPGIFPIRGYLLYQVCNQRICSIPLKSWFEASVSIIH